MQPDILITGGKIIDPLQKINAVCNILITNGLIAKISKDTIQTPQGTSIINAKGLIVCPGFIDLHCHLREPGYEDKETIKTGTRAAAAGGFTTICCMPNTNPALDNISTLNYVKRKASDEGTVRVLPIASITKGRQGKEITEMAELTEAGAIGFSDDGCSVSSSRVLSLAMEYCRDLDMPIIEHCEDKDLAEGGSINEGWVSVRLGLKGIPAEAEEIIVARDIALSKLTGARLHIAHASTKGTVRLIEAAREIGLKITAEVTPHHLTLTEERVLGINSTNGKKNAYDTNTKVNPPLRSQSDIDALLQGLKSGVIDAIATDHAPHTLVEKLCEMGIAAFGISGFETALGCLMSLIHSGQLDLTTMIAALTCKPAAIIGEKYGKLGTLIPGAAGDVAIFDPDKEWLVDTNNFYSKGKNTPYDQQQLKGKVMATIFSGKIVHQDTSLSIERN